MASKYASIFLCFGITLIGAVFTPAIFGMARLYKSFFTANHTIKCQHKSSVTDTDLKVNSAVVKF
jgi:hypothetical protein